MKRDAIRTGIPGAQHLAEASAALAAVLALGVYALTLCRGAYPGESANLMAAAAGALPPTAPLHPVWSVAGWLLARLPLLPLAVRLNLFSAVCGAAAVGMSCLVVARFIRNAARDGDRMAAGLPTEDAGDDEAPEVPRLPRAPGAVASQGGATGRRVNVAATVGGLAAASALAFSAPFWSAATRCQYQTFDVLLLLCAAYSLLRYRGGDGFVWLSVAAALWGLGFGEAPEFAVATPFVAVILAHEIWEREESADVGALVALASGACGLCACLLLAWLDAWLGGAGSAVAAVNGLLRESGGLLAGHFAASGGVVSLMQTLLPFLVVLFAARRTLAAPEIGIRMLHLLLAVIVISNLLDSACSPWALARASGYLPVMSYLLVALTAGHLAAYGYLDATFTFQSDEEGAGEAPGRVRTGYALGLAILAVLCVAPARNHGDADGRKGAFADAVAREMVAQLDGRTWLVGDDLPAGNLLLCAREQGVTLHLVSPHGRVRVQAANLSVPAWFAGDAAVEDQAAVSAPADLWTVAGCHAVPHGLVFAGVRDVSALSGADTYAWHRRFWERLERALPATNGLPPALASLRADVARRAGLAADDLGVLLDAEGQTESAWASYAQARRFDPGNVSALLNQFELAHGGEGHAEARERLEAQVGQLIRQGRAAPAVWDLAGTCGELRNPGRYDQMRRDAERDSLPAPARTALQTAAEFGAGDETGRNGLLLAILDIRPEACAGREQADRQRLVANPVDARAFTELAALAVCRGRAGEAQHWIEQALTAGAARPDLCLLQAASHIVACRADLAVADLTAALGNAPGDLALWSCLAAAWLQQRNTEDVEHRVLAGMRATSGGDDRWQIQTVQGYLSLARGPTAYGTARTAFLGALRLKPDVVGVRDALLMLDVARLDARNTEQDASDTLASEPAHAFANYLLAEALIGQQAFPRAESLLRASLAARRTAAAQARLTEVQGLQHHLPPEAEGTARLALKAGGRTSRPW